MHEFLDYASKMYYEGTPIITDAEFDVLAELYQYEKVGHHAHDGIPHPSKMYSLKKAYEGEGPYPISGIDLVRTPKLDGAAVDLVYINGSLKFVITRGDGNVGQDVSHLIDVFPAPKTVGAQGLVQITGEVAAPSYIENARNYASGALGLKDVREFSTRNLSFIAYGVQPCYTDRYLDDLGVLQTEGFQTVIDNNLQDFPTDGLVFRLNSNKAFELMGYTAHHPRGAFALKTRKVGVVTKLLDVVWQVGKSGVVSPVGILEPVVIGGATVSRATLHNMKYINDLDLEIGCDVEVVRAGEIVPRVLRRV